MDDEENWEKEGTVHNICWEGLRQTKKIFGQDT